MYLKLISQIENLRKINNKNWMALIKVSFKYAPIETAKVIKKINNCDVKISNLLKKLSANVK